MCRATAANRNITETFSHKNVATLSLHVSIGEPQDNKQAAEIYLLFFEKIASKNICENDSIPTYSVD
jgi:hypothetical protein